MKLTIDGEAFEFDESHMTNVEGMAIERATGMLYGEWAEALQKGSMLAQTALVWVVKKRREPALRFDDVVFSSVEVETPEGDASDPEPESESEPTG